MRREDLDGDSIFLIHDFFDEEECRRSISFSEARGYADAPITTASGYVMVKDVRNNTRVMVESVGLAVCLFDRARPLLPAQVDGWHLHGMNERFRYYRYDIGQCFCPHYDGCYRRNTSEESQLTFLIYLNDDFEGGTTDFYDGRDKLKIRVRPKRGSALVFVHGQLHAGTKVTCGRKYVLRTDVMSRVLPPKPKEGVAP